MAVPNTRRGYDFLFKLLTIGDSGVGKTCLLLRFCDDSFSDSFITTVGVDFRFRSINVNGKMVKLQVWDTAGQERFRTITTAYYKGAHGIMLVYDITDRKTFEQISTVWLETVRQNSVNNGEMILIGNKCDIPESRQVTEEEAREFASLNNMPFFECSAKTGFNVDNAFCAIAENLTNREDLTNTRKTVQPMVELNNSGSSSKGGCKCQLL